jgi:hypothetical protein
MITAEARRRRDVTINSIYCRKKREERKANLYYVFFNLRIFACFAAENYFFLCVSSPLRLNPILVPVRPHRIQVLAVVFIGLYIGNQVSHGDDAVHGNAEILLYFLYG